MAVGCQSGGWSRRTTDVRSLARAQQEPLVPAPFLAEGRDDTSSLSYSDQQYGSSIDDQQYGDDLWSDHPIGNSYRVSCSTEEAFTEPAGSSNMVFEK